MATDYRSQLGLGFIKKRDTQPEVEGETIKIESEKFLEEAMLAYGRKVMEAMAKAPQRATTVFKLVDEIGVGVNTLGPVIEWLCDKKYVEIVSEDLKGDHEVKLTDRGERILS
jgi:hypothetical protein